MDLTEELTATLQEMLRRRREQFLKRGERKIPEWVFLSPEGKPVSHSNFTNRVWLPLCEKLRGRHKIRKRHFHHLRHTYATLLLQS